MTRIDVICGQAADERATSDALTATAVALDGPVRMSVEYRTEVDSVFSLRKRFMSDTPKETKAVRDWGARDWEGRDEDAREEGARAGLGALTRAMRGGAFYRPSSVKTCCTCTPTTSTRRMSAPFSWTALWSTSSRSTSPTTSCGAQVCARHALCVGHALQRWPLTPPHACAHRLGLGSSAFPIRVTHPSRSLYHGHHVIYLFVPIGVDKESWVIALRHGASWFNEVRRVAPAPAPLCRTPYS